MEIVLNSSKLSLKNGLKISDRNRLKSFLCKVLRISIYYKVRCPYFYFRYINIHLIYLNNLFYLFILFIYYRV